MGRSRSSIRSLAVIYCQGLTFCEPFFLIIFDKNLKKVCRGLTPDQLISFFLDIEKILWYFLIDEGFEKIFYSL
jgi:hypothetical protein